MDHGPVVAIVDAYATASHLAPLFRARGCACVHVRSAPTVPAIYAASFRAEDFHADIVHSGDTHATSAAVGEFRPVAVLAGTESGVELADLLSESLGLRSNGTALSRARRDKFQMMETVKAAGLRGTEQVRATSREELLTWFRETGERIVVKPVRSLGTDSVHFCDDAHQVAAACDAILGARSLLAELNDAVIGQEYLHGTEYGVHTVSLDGQHHVCDIWDTQRLRANGIPDLLGGSRLLPRRGPVQDQLTDYTFAVLDALGIRHGPATVELRLTPDGPCLIEVGARVCGAYLPLLVRAAVGEGQLEWTTGAYLDPDGFLARHHQGYTLRQHAARIHMVSRQEGILERYPRLSDIRNLESFHELLVHVAPGDRLRRSVNDFTYPLSVFLLHEAEETVLRDITALRRLDGDDFYAVRQPEPTTAVDAPHGPTDNR
ncbi:ATP-grasp domain-containing protein [Streptomyces smyrnaeus]|uniref:ATP-grasp domain-containing protein n=1 Tax=Streptomyces smyrnaeus TaxID=1387713 RepID=UPI0033B276D1